MKERESMKDIKIRDKENKKKCVECGKIFNSIGLGDDECFTCSYVTAMIEREYE